MEILFAIVAILIIGAIIALLILKKKQQVLDDEPVVPTDVLQRTARPSSEDIFNELAHESKPEVDPIEKVDRLIGDNRHDEAVNELKRLLLSNPKNSIAVLKLLQVYVLTNNFGAFDKVYQKLKESGDTETLEQAESYRLLLDDAMPKPAAAVEQDTKVDSLDFDMPITQTPSHAEPTISTAVQNETSLSEFEDFNFDDPLGTSSSLESELGSRLETPTLTSSADDAFDLDFGTALDSSLRDNLSSTPKADTADSSLDLGSSLDDGLSFDGAFDLTSEPTNQTSTTSINNSGTLDTEFDLGDFGLDSTPTPTPNKPSLDDSFDLDFNLGGDSSTQASTTEVASDDFDLGSFDLGSSEPTASTKSDGLDFSSDFGGLELDGFDVGGLNAESNAPSAPQATAEFDLGSDNFGLSLDGLTTNSPALDKPSVKTESNDLGLDVGGLDDFDFGNTNDLGRSNTLSDSLDNSLDIGSLDDVGGLDILTTNNTPAEAPATDEFALGDFDFNTFTETTPAQATSGTNEIDGFDLGDFSLDTSKTETPKVGTPVASESIAKDDGFDLNLDVGGLDIGGESAKVDATPTSLGAVEESKPSLDDFSFNLPEISTADTASASETTASSDLGDFELSAKSEPVVPKAPTSSFELPAFDMAEVAAPVVNTPAPAPSFDASLTQGLDSAGVTLDLAQQYMTLGEYDSAKHLLEEVVLVGNADQSRTASNLLKRLS